MLSKPSAGWTNVSIGNFEDRASYLTDVPVVCLKAMIFTYRNAGAPFCVTFDAEGWEYTVVIEHYETNIIVRKDELELISLSTDRDTLAGELISDIEANMNDWIEWEPGYEDKDELLRRDLLLSLVHDLRSEMAKRDTYFRRRSS